jgi:hypothetical protein
MIHTDDDITVFVLDALNLRQCAIPVLVEMRYGTRGLCKISQLYSCGTAMHSCNGTIRGCECSRAVVLELLHGYLSMFELAGHQLTAQHAGQLLSSSCCMACHSGMNFACASGTARCC